MNSQNRPLREVFNIPGSKAVLEDLYKEEVRLRNREYIPDERLARCIEQCGAWMEDAHSTFGLLLSGNPGNGKTTMVRALRQLITLSEQPDPVETDFYGMPDVAYLNVVSALELTALYSRNPSEYARLKNSGLLAIDDLGVEAVDVKYYGNIVSPITEVLCHRYEASLVTIVTTNLANSQIKERYDMRISDRFNEMMTSVGFPNVSFRRRAIQESVKLY